MGASSPKDENRETEVIAASVSSFMGGAFCEKIIGEMLGFLDYFLYLCRVKERWLKPSKQP